jgi:hypothetical protein
MTDPTLVLPSANARGAAPKRRRGLMNHEPPVARL